MLFCLLLCPFEISHENVQGLSRQKWRECIWTKSLSNCGQGGQLDVKFLHCCMFLVNLTQISFISTVSYLCFS